MTTAGRHALQLYSNAVLTIDHRQVTLSSCWMLVRPPACTGVTSSDAR